MPKIASRYNRHHRAVSSSRDGGASPPAARLAQRSYCRSPSRVEATDVAVWAEVTVIGSETTSVYPGAVNRKV